MDDQYRHRCFWRCGLVADQGEQQFEDWITVGQALAIGRTETLKAAKCNRPVGTTYNRLIGQWLKQHGLDGMSTQERYRALLCHENLAAISAWRDDLDEVQRRRQNHPNLVWQAWRRATKTGTPGPTRQQIAQRVAAARNGHAIFWPSHCLRRAHEAMLKSRSNDLLVLARAALEAAIPTADVLAELLDMPKSPPNRAAPATAAVVHAA